MRKHTAKTKRKTGLYALILAIASIITTTLSASKEMDALLNILVQRNVLNEEDVSTIKEEVAQAVAEEAPSSSANPISNSAPTEPTVVVANDPRLKLNSAVKVFNPYGDLRLRYQAEDTSKPGANSQQRSRWRYRLRAGLNYGFDSNWSAGIRLETASANDSTNANFGGFFDKQGDEVYVGLIFAKYASDTFEFIAGKHKHPYHIPSAFWDSDINPEGFSEVWYTDNITIRASQFVIDEEDERKPGAEDDFLFMAQAEFNVGKLKLSPMIMTSTNNESSNDENKKGFKGENYANYFKNFQVIALPFTYKFETSGGTPQKIAGIVGINLRGGDALNDPDSPFWGGAPQDDDKNLFASLGYTFGKAKKKNTWQVGLEYRYVEAASYTPNLLDSDYAKDELNMQGFVLKTKWAHTDFLSTGLSYFHGVSIDKDFSSPVAGLADAKMLQLDLMVKF